MTCLVRFITANIRNVHKAHRNPLSVTINLHVAEFATVCLSLQQIRLWWENSNPSGMIAWLLFNLFWFSCCSNRARTSTKHDLIPISCLTEFPNAVQMAKVSVPSFTLFLSKPSLDFCCLILCLTLFSLWWFQMFHENCDSCYIIAATVMTILKGWVENLYLFRDYMCMYRHTWGGICCSYTSILHICPHARSLINRFLQSIHSGETSM